MKQTPLKRSSSLGRGKKNMKRSQPKRDWQAAREKVVREDYCRLGSEHGSPTGILCDAFLEAAHIIGRERDCYQPDEPDMRIASSVLPVLPERIVPLCRRHHRMYDAHELDLLPYLTVEEQAQAVLDAGGLELARRRLAPLAYRNERNADVA